MPIGGGGVDKDIQNGITNHDEYHSVVYPWECTWEEAGERVSPNRMVVSSLR